MVCCKCISVIHKKKKQLLKIKLPESGLHNTPIESNTFNLLFTDITFTTERHNEKPTFLDSNLTRIDDPNEDREG